MTAPMTGSLLLRSAALLFAGFLIAIATAPLWSDHRLAAGAVAGIVAAGAAALARRGATSRPPATAPDPALQAEPVLDLSALAALRAIGEEAFVREVAGQFEAEGRVLMLRIASAVAARDAADFAAQTHALRSSAANVGARRLFTLCLNWRDLPAHDLAAGGAARLDALQREFDAASNALRKALRETLPASPACDRHAPHVAQTASAR